MNYVYDTLINFNKTFFDFFEWDKNDKIKRFKKIPLIKVSINDFNNLKYGIVKINEFNKQKADYFNKNSLAICYRCFLFCTNEDVICIKFDKHGFNHLLSDLLLDDKEEILDIAIHINESKINYNLKKRKKINFLSKREFYKKESILNKINSSNTSKENDKLKYLYFECFNKKESNIKIIIDSLNNNIDEIIDAADRFYNLNKH